MYSTRPTGRRFAEALAWRRSLDGTGHLKQVRQPVGELLAVAAGALAVGLEGTAAAFPVQHRPPPIAGRLNRQRFERRADRRGIWR
jgi:hypothetical protein